MHIFVIIPVFKVKIRKMFGKIRVVNPVNLLKKKIWIPYNNLFVASSFWMVNLCSNFNLTPFASNLSNIYPPGSGSMLGIRIRIHKGPEYGSNLDPDSQHCKKSKIWVYPGIQVTFTTVAESKDRKLHTAGSRYKSER